MAPERHGSAAAAWLMGLAVWTWLTPAWADDGRAYHPRPARGAATLGEATPLRAPVRKRVDQPVDSRVRTGGQQTAELRWRPRRVVRRPWMSSSAPTTRHKRPRTEHVQMSYQEDPFESLPERSDEVVGGELPSPSNRQPAGAPPEDTFELLPNQPGTQPAETDSGSDSTVPAPALQQADAPLSPPDAAPVPIDLGPVDTRPDDFPPPAPSDTDMERPSRGESGERQQEECDQAVRKLRDMRISSIGLDIGVQGEAGDDFPFECTISGGPYAPRMWPETIYTWKASALCHKPLYFEQLELERYGHCKGPFVQPLCSGAHFFATLPILPYKMGLKPPTECVYTLGHYRPGSCAPYLISPLPISARAALFQAGAVVGTAAVLP